MPYSEKFKERMVRRMIGPAGISANALSKEVGVAQPTLSKWLRASVGTVSKDGESNERLDDRAPEEKAALVIEARGLSGEELGAFLRRNGLHEADLEDLKAWLAERLDPKASRRQEEATRKARKADQKKIKQLEKELRHKEKALAETAALLVLSKKFNALMGVEGDDTTETNDE